MIRGAGRLNKRMDERAKWEDRPACCSTDEGWVCTLDPEHGGDHEAWATELMHRWARLQTRVRDGRHLMPNDEVIALQMQANAIERQICEQLLAFSVPLFSLTACRWCGFDPQPGEAHGVIGDGQDGCVTATCAVRVLVRQPARAFRMDGISVDEPTRRRRPAGWA